MNPTPALIAAAVALVLVLVAHGLRGDDGRRPIAIALAALAPVAAVLLANHLQGASVSIPPTRFKEAALFAGVVALPIAWVVGSARGALVHALGVLAFAVGAVTLFYFATDSLHARDWKGQVPAMVAALSGLAVFAYVGRLAAESKGRSTEALLATAIAALGASPALGWSGTGVAALNAAALSASAGLLGLYTVLRPAFRVSLQPMGRALATTQTALLGGLLATGVLYAATPRTAGILLLTAPCLVLAPGGSKWAAVVRLVLVAGVTAFAAYLAKGEPNPYS